MTAETNMERLQKIKDFVPGLLDMSDNEGIGSANLLNIMNDFDWLVQQSERVQELEDELTEWHAGQNMNSEHYNHLRQLNLENARLRKRFEKFK